MNKRRNIESLTARYRSHLLPISNQAEIDLADHKAYTNAPNTSFETAFKYALDQGHIQFGMVNFAGWQEDCNCAKCRCQRIIFDYLWPDTEIAKEQ